MKGDGALDRYALRRLVRQAGERLKAAGVASPEHDARELAEWILGTRLPLVDGADEAFAATYEEAVRRRAAREPLQRITGRMFFRSLELECRPGVFIVRPETEVVAGAAIEAALARERGGVASGPLVVDLCAGSGAIAAAVAVEVPTARVAAVELADEACAAAVDTCERYAPGRVRVVQADAAAPSTLAELDGSVDVVVTNPPYVPAGAIEDVETASYDPRLALFGGGDDGLDLPVALVRRAGALLRDDGLLVMEHDAGQGRALREAALAGGFHEASTGQDLTGRDRFLRAVR
ncbi:HemK family protein methyltransferase [uncultured Actinomyces sp.]|uniref:N5-glutamine methyltransferase family protein n=1 Tax=uncultured Actinomyces sp. TaxID=249061 RepID=UPI00288950C1|nr:HemK family protein methyltransferase [uncultured Actinomyces sp.]